MENLFSFICIHFILMWPIASGRAIILVLIGWIAPDVPAHFQNKPIESN